MSSTTVSTTTSPATSSPVSPTARSLARSARGPVLVAAALVLVAVAVGFVEGSGRVGYLDTDSYSHEGSHAVATLLRNQGVPVRQVRTVADAAATTGGTLVVTGPDLLPSGAARRIAASGASTVVIVGATTDDTLHAFVPGVSVLRPVDTSVRQPACDLAAAAQAGSADAGGATYDAGSDNTGSDNAGTDACYPVGGEPSLLVVRTATRTVVLVGAADPFLNGRITRQGNAALALNLLGGDAAAGVTWYLPSLDDLYGAGGGPRSQRSLTDLLPDSIHALMLWSVVVLLLLVAWRGRRLGAVVPEALPVVVRASETVEGRARLYRRGRTRGRAAELLRAATRDRLTSALGLPTDPPPESVVETVAARSGRAPVDVAALLYGAAPSDDAALVGLADRLDQLERTMLAGTTRPEGRQ